MAWKNSDFATVFQFLRDIRELIRTAPESIGEYREILAQDAQDATDCLRKIADAMAVDA